MIGYSGQSKIERLRAFSEGRQPHTEQPVNKEKKQSPILDVNGNAIEYEVDMFSGYNPQHEVWDILSPANKIMDALYGTLSKLEFNISSDPLDYSTRHKIENDKLFAWQYSKNKTKIQFAAQLAGVEVPEPSFVPETAEDLDNNDELFAPDHCRYIEQVVKHSFDIAHWAPDIVELFYRDLFSNGKACIKNEYDPETGKVKPTYISLSMGDIQPSQWIDCRDSERGFHFELMSISRLRQYFPDKEEDWFRQVAGSYCSMFGNPTTGIFDRYDTKNAYGNWMYDSFKACVLHTEWIDVNTTKETVGTKNGRKVVKEVPLSKKVAQDKTVRFKDERMRYQCSWVIGSDDIFEYGPAFDTTFPSENDTELTYKWIVLKGKSKIEQLIPILINLQDLWDKYKDLLRNAMGKYQIVDIDKLASTAGEKETPQDAAKKAFRRMLATGKVLIRRVNAAGMPDQSQPVSEMDGGMGTLFQEIQQGFNFNFGLVEYITGLNPSSLGQMADPSQPVTTAQMAQNATANVLRPLVDGYMREKQMIAENLARWIIVAIRGNEFSRNAYRDVIGEYGVQALLTASKDEASYGFRMMPQPDDLQKQFLLQNLTMATTPQPGAEREISTADANLILNMISSGEPVKSIQFVFEKARKRQEAAMMKKKEQLMKQQSELNKQDSAASSQAAQQAQAMAHDQEMQRIEAKNKGLVANTAVQEQMRDQKEQNVQNLKNQGAATVESMKPKPEDKKI